MCFPGERVCVSRSAHAFRCFLVSAPYGSRQHTRFRDRHSVFVVGTRVHRAPFPELFGIFGTRRGAGILQTERSWCKIFLLELSWCRILVLERSECKTVGAEPERISELVKYFDAGAELGAVRVKNWSTPNPWL
jgi:hypothetical protein